MTAAILSHAGMDPTVVVGGRVGLMGGSNARLGRSNFLVVESDESDGSFLKLSPIIAIVTNIDREHLDHYADIEAIRSAFTDFVTKVPFYGAAILCLDDDNVQQILPSIRRRVTTYGVSAQADLVVTSASCGHLSSTFRLRHKNDELGEFHLRVPGTHNVLNATAAVAVGLELEVPPDAIREGLNLFTGVDRRFQMRGQEKGVTVFDDYGHHPTEIRATLAAARDCHFSRLHAIFQPHRYTRTMHLMDDFARSFNHADSVYLLDVYAASEKPIEGISSERLAERMRAFGHRSVTYSGTLENAVEAVAATAVDGDAVLTLGAGNVWQAGDKLLQKLKGTA
jgi:UDP-N-acetylmuramate--alanine ligase